MTIDEFLVADSADAWRAAGFAVDEDGVCRVGTTRLRLSGRDQQRGIVGWSLRDAPMVDNVDGVETTNSTSPPAQPGTHPNGVTSIDHAVLMTPDLPRTVEALEHLGQNARRTRDGNLNGQPIRQVFFRFGEVVLEVVGPPEQTDDGPARFWGLTFTVEDIDATAARLGDCIGRVKDAVQPGRRIATLRHRDLDISVATAFISPDPR